MKKEWKYEGKKYVVYDDREGNLYLNCHLCDCFDIAENIDHPNGKIVRQTKQKAKELLIKIESDIAKEKQRRKRLIEEAERARIVDEKIKAILCSAPVFIAAIALLAGIFYLIYQVWWFFVGDWAFNGPFADDISAGEVTFETILLFIAFIVIIEEVVRRIRNGHF